MAGWLGKHVAQCLLAGIVALLPIAGFALTVFYLEEKIASSWLSRHAWYFPGLGLLAAAIGIYLIGLTVTTVVGRWVWRLFDRLFDNIPALGQLYRTLKQIVGYGDGKDAIFRSVVLVPNGEADGAELGLVTNEIVSAAGARQFVVFVPEAPNPTAGRLVVIDAARVRPVNLPVSDALRILLSVGKIPIPIGSPPA
jgi:uncharacterized membrane protein